VSESQTFPLPAAAAIFVGGAPFLALALRRASELLPARPAPEYRWKKSELLAVCLTPFAVFALLAALLPQQGVVASLLWNELVFGVTGGLAIALAVRRPAGLASLGLASAAPPRALLAMPIVYVPWFVCVAVGLGSAWVHLCRARQWEEQQAVMQMILGLRGGELVLAAFVAMLVGPFLEELLFRGFLQSALAPALGQRGALVTSSLLFAAMHGLPGLPVLFSLSLLLGWLQMRTRSLLVPWSAHAFHNGIQLLLALTFVHG